MKRYVLLSGLLAALFVPFTVEAQAKLSTTSKKAIALYTEADNYRVRGQYAKAIELLHQAIHKDKDFEEAYFRLGVTLKNSDDLPESSAELEKGLLLATEVRRQNNYRYELADNYLRRGDYTRSLTYSTAFLNGEKMGTRADQAKVWKQNAEYGSTHQGENLAYAPHVLSDTINRFPVQYFPVLTADARQLIFTMRDGPGIDDHERIVISVKNDEGKWTTPVSISDKINSGLHQGTCAISADGRYLIFTGCGPKTYGICDLFESKKTGENWTAPVNIGPMVNSSAWDSNPALSADGQELYFSSGRKGGEGGYDIWYTRKDSLGRWTRAQNAGNTINTRFDEISPFLHVNNKNLYFASNAHPGFGGFDIFVSEHDDKQWTAPRNMGAPLNNYEDQFSFFVTADGKTAYYSKDESGKKDNSKLYTTPLPEQVQVRYSGNVVTGKVTDQASGLPLQAQVELYDIRKNERLSFVQSDSLTGAYTMVLTTGAEYALYTTSPGYLFRSLSFNYAAGDHQQPVGVNIGLQKVKLNAITVLNNIFFETDKFELEEKSVTELQEVVRFLKSNPTVRVEIGGHTDNIGSTTYNLQLSRKRAQSVADYLVLHGIAANRIEQKGYGEQQPVKSNDTEENKRENRRIEFKIIN